MDSAGHNDGVTAPASAKPPKTSRARMTGRERREQLIGVGRKHFADKGFEGTTIEEIAASAGVSKPVVYEHFGGKEGLYAVVVDREIESLLSAVQGALTSEGTSPARSSTSSRPSSSPTSSTPRPRRCTHRCSSA